MTKSFLFIKIGSETTKISLNIAICNICVPSKIFDNLKKPLKKRNSALYVVFQPMPIKNSLKTEFNYPFKHETDILLSFKSSDTGRIFNLKKKVEDWDYEVTLFYQSYCTFL